MGSGGANDTGDRPDAVDPDRRLDDGDDVPGIPVDLGVERLLRLLWLFRHRDRTRTFQDIEACGYSDVQAEGSTGRKNFANDRARLVKLGLSLGQTADGNRWTITGEPDGVLLVLTDAEREALTEAQLLVAEPDSPAPRHTQPYVPGAVPFLLTAISDGHPVRFTYGDVHRFIDPHRVVVDATNRWYLLGVDRRIDSGDRTRTFRVDRITQTAVDRDEAVEPLPAGVSWSLHPTAWPTDASVDVTVRFEHDPLPEWFAMLGTPLAVAAPGPDGAVTATFRGTNHHAFIRRTLAIGAHIVHPPSITVLAREALAAHESAFGVS